MANEEPQTKKARTAGSLTVGWFRNDLRLRDNPMLETLLEQAKANSLPALLVYIFDPRFYDRVTYGRVTDMTYSKSISTRRGGKENLPISSRKCNGRRARFYLNVLRDLKRGLGELGTELVTFYGKPEDVFTDLSAQYGALDVVCLREPVSPEWTDVEENVEALLKQKGGSLTCLWGAMSLYHEDDVPFQFKWAPGSYSGLASAYGWEDIWTSTKQFDGATPIKQPIAAPTGPWSAQKVASPPKGSLTDALLDDDRAALAKLGYSAQEIEETLKVPHGGSRKGKGGETAAWARFNAWMEKEPEAEKKDPKFVPLGGEFGAAGAMYIEDGEIDPFQWKNLSTANGWTQVSKYMACGCISPREMYHTLLAKQHWALPGLVHRLMWREWHRTNAIKFHRKLYWLQGPGKQNMTWREDPVAAEKWKTGQTGVPYMDAVMRELNQTGWISYAARKTVACFLSHDLWVDWRVGGFHFEEMLLDYDVAMNYGNWTFCVRVDKAYGGDPSQWRSPKHEGAVEKLNAIATNDPEGLYIKQWCPELKDVPAKHVNAPWKMTAEEMNAAKCVVGKDYPEPLIRLELDKVEATEATPCCSGCKCQCEVVYCRACWQKESAKA